MQRPCSQLFERALKCRDKRFIPPGPKAVHDKSCVHHCAGRRASCTAPPLPRRAALLHGLGACLSLAPACRLATTTTTTVLAAGITLPIEVVHFGRVQGSGAACCSTLATATGVVACPTVSLVRLIGGVCLAIARTVIVPVVLIP